jgi:hypothetical protein
MAALSFVICYCDRQGAFLGVTPSDVIADSMRRRRGTLFWIALSILIGHGTAFGCMPTPLPEVSTLEEWVAGSPVIFIGHVVDVFPKLTTLPTPPAVQPLLDKLVARGLTPHPFKVFITIAVDEPLRGNIGSTIKVLSQSCDQRFYVGARVFFAGTSVTFDVSAGIPKELLPIVEKLRRHEGLSGRVLTQKELRETAPRLDVTAPPVAQVYRLTQYDMQASPSEHALAVMYAMSGNYQDALALDNDMASVDPKNEELKFSVSWDLENLGDTQLALGDTLGAIASFEETRSIREGLARADPNNVGWQQALAESYAKLALVLWKDRPTRARDALMAGRTIIETWARVSKEGFWANQELEWFDGAIAGLQR